MLTSDEALRSGRITQAAYGVLKASGLDAHRLSFVTSLEALAELHVHLDAHSDGARALDATRREIKTLRSVAIGESVLIDRRSGNVVALSSKFARLVEAGIADYGLVLPWRDWDFDSELPSGLRLISETEWREARARQIQSGRWNGAFSVRGGEVVLPGIKALRDLGGDAEAVADREPADRYGSSRISPDARRKVVARLTRAETEARRLVSASYRALALAEIATVWKRIDRRRELQILRDAAMSVENPNRADDVIGPKIRVIAMLGVARAIRELDPGTASVLVDKADRLITTMTDDQEVDVLRTTHVMVVSEKDFAKGLEIAQGIRTKRPRFFAAVALAVSRPGSDPRGTAAALNLINDDGERRAARALLATRGLDDNPGVPRRAWVAEVQAVLRVWNSDGFEDVARILAGIAGIYVYLDDETKGEQYFAAVTEAARRTSQNAAVELAGFAEFLGRHRPSRAAQAFSEALRLARTDGSLD